MSKIDGQLLEKAINEIALEQIHAEIREWIMTSPLTINRIYGRYLELAAQQDEKDPEV